MRLKLIEQDIILLVDPDMQNIKSISFTISGKPRVMVEYKGCTKQYNSFKHDIRHFLHIEWIQVFDDRVNGVG